MLPYHDVNMLLPHPQVLTWGFMYYIGRRPAHGTEAWRPALVEGLGGQQIQQVRINNPDQYIHNKMAAV